MGETSDDMQPDNGLFSVAQIRAVEAAAFATVPPDTLMQRAGAAAAAFAAELLRGQPGNNLGRSSGQGGPRVLVAAGPGNNGGDAFECAAGLAHMGCAVTVVGTLTATDAIETSDRGRAFGRARAVSNELALAGKPRAGAFPGSVTFTDFAAIEQLCSQPWSLVIDGLFGIGLARPLNGAWADIIAALNRVAAPRLALDVPSGLDADTGMLPLPPSASAHHAQGKQSRNTGACFEATHTLTFIGDKPGLHTGDGRDLAGRVTLAGLGISPALYPLPLARLNRPATFDAPCHRRRQNSHKGSFGDVQVVGGAAGMTGAAILAALAALKTGSGRVLLGFVDAAHAQSGIAGHPELMCRLAADMDFAAATVVIGPGLGDGVDAQALVARACTSARALVLDADGLNLVAGSPVLQRQLAERSMQRPTLITPHPLEAARLLGMSAAAVQADRLKAATALAERFCATVVLKGSGTVIAHAGGLTINPTGNPALASGGTGDVLAGICGALLAQGWPAHQAALAAVWIHGAAADALVAAGIGPVGVTASEIIDAARTVLNRLIGWDAGMTIP